VDLAAAFGWLLLYFDVSLAWLGFRDPESWVMPEIKAPPLQTNHQNVIIFSWQLGAGWIRTRALPSGI
jgi:hypothetical protein